MSCIYVYICYMLAECYQGFIQDFLLGGWKRFVFHYTDFDFINFKIILGGGGGEGGNPWFPPACMKP